MKTGGRPLWSRSFSGFLTDKDCLGVYRGSKWQDLESGQKVGRTGHITRCPGPSQILRESYGKDGVGSVGERRFYLQSKKTEYVSKGKRTPILNRSKAVH